MLRNYSCLLCKRSLRNVARRTIWNSSNSTVARGASNLQMSNVIQEPSARLSRLIDPHKGFIRRCHSESMSLVEYTDIVSDTLEDLADHFDHLADEGFFDEGYDCILADGVMTVNLGQHGIYVINKQTPNRQIWLSSPVRFYTSIGGK
eukprot:TCONS_00012030-protein